MSEYIVTCDEETASWIGDDADSMKPVVRCRDCEHYVEDPQPIDPGWPMMCEDSGRDMVEPDGFCAWGEKVVES